LKIFKEIPWGDGIGKLINFAFIEEPTPVSIIVGNLNRVI
jgi:hypothetical protein